jgi:acetylornithine deacetylase/succinyl-diaminopimelate desuccinylase-like protein
MLFVPCRNGISHSRDEHVSPEQVARGSEVLREALRHLAGAMVEPDSD